MRIIMPRGETWRVHQYQFELLFKKIPDRFPVNASEFHRYVCDAIHGKTGGKFCNVMGNGPEPMRMIFLAARSADQNTGADGGL
jgi:hypothetical protein